MSEQNHLLVEKKAEQRVVRRSKKKRPGMKVSGSGVKKLQKLIVSKSKRV